MTDDEQAYIQGGRWLMEDKAKKPLALRILSSRFLWAVVFVLLTSFLVIWGTGGLANTVTDKQAQFVADSVRRSAVQCYAIEGSFPPTVGGLEYLKEGYGLAIDEKRYVVYYESLGDNLIPQIRVIPVPQTSPTHDIADFLGLPDWER
jgi:hypothetical protein